MADPENTSSSERMESPAPDAGSAGAQADAQNQSQPQARTDGLSVLIPFLLGLTSSATATAAAIPTSQEQGSAAPPPAQSIPSSQSHQALGAVQEGRNQYIVFFNMASRSMMIVQGSGELNFGAEKAGPSPASKAAIEAMPRVAVAESGWVCSICLEEAQVGDEARVMPCKHSFHSDCIEKWLGISGSCPLCRYTFPLEQEGEQKSDGGEDGARRDGPLLTVHAFLVGDDWRVPGSGSGSGSGSGEDGSMNSDAARSDDVGRSPDSVSDSNPGSPSGRNEPMELDDEVTDRS